MPNKWIHSTKIARDKGRYVDPDFDIYNYANEGLKPLASVSKHGAKITTQIAGVDEQQFPSVDEAKAFVEKILGKK